MRGDGGRRVARAFRVLGTDGAGERVAAVGARVRRFKVGDRVWACSFRTRRAVSMPSTPPCAPTSGARPRPRDLLHAGAAAATGMTALQGVDDALHVRKREAVIIHGAAGVRGKSRDPVREAAGSRVLATASGRDGLALVRRLGADAAVDGRRGHRRGRPAVRARGRRCGARLRGRQAPHPMSRRAPPRRGRVAYPNGVEPRRERRGLRVMILRRDPWNARVSAPEPRRRSRPAPGPD